MRVKGRGRGKGRDTAMGREGWGLGGASVHLTRLHQVFEHRVRLREG